MTYGGFYFCGLVIECALDIKRALDNQSGNSLKHYHTTLPVPALWTIHVLCLLNLLQDELVDEYILTITFGSVNTDYSLIKHL